MKFEKRYREIMNEAKKIETSEEFISDLEKVIKKSFPKSSVKVGITGLSGESLLIKFSLGNGKSEYPNGIIHNDPVHTHIWIFDLLPFDPNKKYKVELGGIGGSITTKPEEDSYLAYDRVKTGWRSFSATPDKIVTKIDKYFSKVKDLLKKLVKDNKISDDHLELVKSKI